MRVFFGRDGVCMRDDVDTPHLVWMDFEDQATVGDVLLGLLRVRPPYLAQISGGKATWVVRGQVPLAVVAQEWEAPFFLIEADTLACEVLSEGEIGIYFDYRSQVDPTRLLSEFSG